MLGSEVMEIIASVLGIITVVVGGIFWLMKVNYRQSKDLLHLERDINSKKISELQAVVDDHKRALHYTNKQLEMTDVELRKVRSEMLETQSSIKTFVQSAETRAQLIESKVIHLSKELMMIKTTKTKQRGT